MEDTDKKQEDKEYMKDIDKKPEYNEDMDVNKDSENENESDDEQSKVSDDDDDKDESFDNDDEDESQPSLMSTFDIYEVQRHINKEDFIGKSDVSSHLFEFDKHEKVADFFGDIFGLHDIYSDSGY